MDLRSGAAFWPLKNGLLHTYPAISRDESADVVVIGAGVTGALVAHRLSSAGAEVVVLDKRDAATGSTAATTGLLQYETDTTLGELTATVGEADAVRVWRLGLEAIAGIGGLCDELGDDCGFARRDSLYLASTKREVGDLRAEYDLRMRSGFEVEWLPAAALRSRFGLDAPAAIHSRGDGEIDAFRFTHRLLAAAAERGARIYDRTEAVDVTAGGDDGVSIETSRGARISCRRVVWATGYESVEETQRRVGSMHSTWVVISEPVADLAGWRDRTLIWETARPYLYARTTGDGRVMIGGEDERWSTRHTSERLLDRKSRRLVERFHDLFPEIAIEVAYRWAGVFTTTADGLPYIGEVPEHPHAWLALGYGGNGITFSMIAADVIRDAWLGTRTTDADIFSFDR